MDKELGFTIESTYIMSLSLSSQRTAFLKPANRFR